MAQQLIDPPVGRRRDRAVRGQQAEVRQLPDLGQRPHEGAQWVEGRWRDKADGRCDRRQDVVAGVERLRVRVHEHIVAWRVARRLHGVQRP
jgi:hypothetical protein